MKKLLTCLAASLLLTGFVRADAEGSNDKLGKKIVASLADLSGKTIELEKLKGQKATVVIFTSFDCPNSNSYSSTLINLNQKYSDKGVIFLGICENDLTNDEIRSKAKEFKLPFTFFADPKQLIADAFKATITPEAFVLDHNLVLRYRGRIDDQFNARLKKNTQIKNHDLQDAIENILAAKPVTTPVTKAVGCSIASKDLVVKSPTTITYHKDVLPILQKNCQTCHRPGEVGPFSLLTYKQAVNWGEDIKEYTASRKMPPFKPNAGVDFLNDRRLTDKEIKTLAEWVDGGMPEGPKVENTTAIKGSDGWPLGKPDFIATATDDYFVGPSGPDAFRCFVIPTNFDEDKYIIGFDVRPSNPQIVHHTLNYWDLTGKARELERTTKEKARPDDRDRGPGYSAAMGVGFLPTSSPRPGVSAIGSWGGWAPGQVPRFLPEGTGYLLPKGADIVIQVHYHRNGKPEKDRTQVGVYLAKKPVEKPFQTLTVGPRGFLLIPPNNENHQIKASMYTQADATLYSVMPHMHLIGKSVKMSMTPPGGETTTLVDIKEWDYNWQETYWLKNPMQLKAGTRLDIEGVYDNSTQNPNNPRNPPAYVFFGEQTTNEMLFGFFGITSKDGKRVFLRPTPPKVDNK